MGLIDRAKNIIVQPKAEWAVIDTEPATVGGLYTGYVIPLSLLSVICATLGMVLFGISVPFLGNIRYPLGTALGSAAVRFVAGLISIYVIALVIDALAPTFGGTKNSIQAFKVAAYSYTAAWVFGVLAIIPALAIIAGLLGLYSLYLLYTGLPTLMKSPPEKALGYTALVIVVAIVLFICIGFLVSALGLGIPTGLPRTM
ncbi:MAG TPA: Yip1 family protein [Gemmatimonadaceae bacterium]|jgi:Yip1-like protein|nr:Yip1 family protein [Gemmatimonadaceae bacterium]